MEDIIGTDEYAKEQEPITRLGENHVYFLPYLMGERSPHNNPNARGTFIGMTMDTSRADMTQAVLEGVAFALRDSLEVAKSLGIKLERTKICGGGAKSPLWKKMIANILNLKVDVIESEEGPALGGAMLAAVACGEYESVEAAAAKIVKIIDTVEPEPELVAKYDYLTAHRGVGLIQGVVCTKKVGEVSAKALEHGLILITAGSDVLRFVPPLVIEKCHVDEMIEKLSACLDELS